MNNTTENVLPSPYGEFYWIASEIIFNVATIFVLYYLFCTIVYVCRLDNKKQRQQKKLIYVTITSLVMFIGRILSNQCVAFLGWQTDELCHNSVSISVVFYSTSLAPVYIFLWMRQHTFYSDSKLKKLYNKHMHIYSYICLTLLATGSVFLTIIYQIPSFTGWNYKATSSGCRDINDHNDLEIPPLLVSILSGLGQVSLLSLLVYPLVKTKQSQKRARKREQVNETTIVVNKSVHSSTNDERKLSTLPQSGQCSSNTGKTGDTEARNKSTEVYTVDSESEEDGEVTKARSAQNQKQWNSSMPVHYTKSPIKSRQRLASGERSRADSGVSSKLMFSRKKASKRVDRDTRKRRKREEKKARKLTLLIEKVFILALVCVATDVIATVLQLVIILPEVAYLAIYDVNLIISVTCVVLSFQNYKKILWPCDSFSMFPRRRSSITSQLSVRTTLTNVGTLERNTLNRRNAPKAFRNPDAASLSSNATGSFTLSRPNSPIGGRDTPTLLRKTIPSTSSKSKF